MKKYFLLEIFTLGLFILSLFTYKRLNLRSEFETFADVYFMVLFLVILIIIPAAVLLTLTERYAPKTMPSKNNNRPFPFPISVGMLTFALFLLFLMLGQNVLISFFLAVISSLSFFLILFKKLNYDIRQISIVFIFALIAFLFLPIGLQLLIIISSFL